MTVTDVEARLDAMPRGALRELWRRAALELGVLDAPAGTVRVDRSFALHYVPQSMNTNDLRSHWKGFAAAKVELQGLFMRELDRLELPRPFPRVGPVWVHVVLRFPVLRERDTADNFRYLVAKALGDALTGPEWVGQGKGRRRAHRSIIFRGARYVAGWLKRDTDRDWILTLEVDEQTGPTRTTVRLVWDQPVQRAA